MKNKLELSETTIHTIYRNEDASWPIYQTRRLKTPHLQVYESGPVQGVRKNEKAPVELERRGMWVKVTKSGFDVTVENNYYDQNGRIINKWVKSIDGFKQYDLDEQGNLHQVYRAPFNSRNIIHTLYALGSCLPTPIIGKAERMMESFLDGQIIQKKHIQPTYVRG